jgi:hypothetical protein
MNYRPAFTLKQMGLPENYGSLSEKERQRCRFNVLTAWFDPNKPDILCSDPKKFVTAMKLWIECYLKPAKVNRGRYPYKDPKKKYEIVEAIMAAPSVATEPSKAVIRAARHYTKTETIIHQAGSMVLSVRPGSKLLIVEANDKRTKEELRKLRRQIEQNDLIHKDFGGRGELFPESRNRGYAWNDSEIELLNGSVCMGVSCMAAHRGRHPDWLIIDDPEKDKKKSQNQVWRREYFDWLFYVMLGMMRRGQHVTWIGTPVDEHACLTLALRGESQLDDDVEAEDGGIEIDNRFDDWHKKAFDLIYEDEEGNIHSSFPDLLPVHAWEAKVKAVGKAAAMAEYQGDPIAAGDRIFERHDFIHGYMKCKDPDAAKGQDPFYFLDLFTGERRPWKEFVEGLATFAANDLADSLDPQADPAAFVCIGVDAAGIVYVLDVWSKRTLVEQHVPKAFELAEKWHCEAMAWEKVAMQRVVVRWAKQLGEEYRKDGRQVPTHIGLTQPKTVGGKRQRIIGALSPLLNRRRLRLLHVDEFTDGEGNTHKPARCLHRRHFNDTKRVIDTFTDQGQSGFIDTLDALEMAVRIAGERKGTIITTDADPIDIIVDGWNEAGFPVTRHNLDWKLWSDKMWEDHQEEFLDEPAVLSASMVDDDMDVDPYG